MNAARTPKVSRPGRRWPAAVCVTAFLLALLAGGCGPGRSDGRPGGAVAAPAGDRAADPFPDSTPDEYEGVVLAVLEAGNRNSPVNDGPTSYQLLRVQITSGPRKGQIVDAENARSLPGTSTPGFQKGDRVIVNLIPKPGPEEFVVTDHLRRPVLYGLALLFAAAAAAVGGWRGFTSIVGLAVTFLILTTLMLPQLLAGRDPVVVSVLGAVLIMVVTLYLSHGISRKTTTAILGTAISLTATGALGWLFVQLGHMTGMTSEEVVYLQVQEAGALDLRGLLLAGVIVGGLGVLDDVTVSQSAIVFALRAANPGLGWNDLYRRAMSVGRDHIASTVNTLVLAYAGTALPLLMLYVSGEVPFLSVLNREHMASEVIRTLVGSLGLIGAVPITTGLAATIALRLTPEQVAREHGHGHAHDHGHTHGHMH